MKTKDFFIGLFMAGIIFTSNAQVTNILYSDRSSVGYQAGVMGSVGGTFFGNYAGKTITSTNNTCIGAYSGYNTASGSGNTFVGRYSGYNTTGNNNVFLGSSVGYNTTTGHSNVFAGVSSGASNTSGGQNIFIGNQAGYSSTTGGSNVYIGQYSATGPTVNGSYNVALGYNAGSNNSGSNNIFIGKSAGTIVGGSTASDQLYIDNSGTPTPLIKGDFEENTLIFNGKVGITNESLTDQINLFPNTAGSVDVSAYQLFVKGGILTEEVRVNLKSTTNWADYVFNDDYPLAPLEEVETYIKENGHLPNVPSAEILNRDGLNLSEIAKVQQEKIEELTLYIIEQNKKLNEQEERLNILENSQKEINELKAFILELKNKEK